MGRQERGDVPSHCNRKIREKQFACFRNGGQQAPEQVEDGSCSRITLRMGLYSCELVLSALGIVSKGTGAGPTLAVLASEPEPSLYKGGNMTSQREGFT